MQYYPEVPIWWYVITGVIPFTFICTAIKMVPTQLPLWAAMIGILISFCLAIPVCMFAAISSQEIPMQVMYELIGGYMVPGHPIANVIFKTVAYITTAHSINCVQNMKLGHYMKIPSRIMFTIQIVSTVITSLLAILIQDWMINNIEDICTLHQKQSFTCQESTVFSTASIIFGAVGPRRLFSPGAL